MIIKALLNTIFVSIPEESLWLILTLILLKRYDLIDRYRLKYNLKWLALPVIVMSVTINMFKYIIVLPSSLSMTITFVLFFLLINHSVKKTDVTKQAKVGKVLVSFTVSTFFTLFIDCLVGLFVTFYLDLSMQAINENIKLNILFSLIPRSIQLALVCYFYIKKEGGLKFINTLLKNKQTIVMTSLFLIFMLVLWVVLMIVFGNFIVAQNFSITMKIFSSIIIIVVPLVLVGLFISVIIYFINQIDKINRYHSNELDDID